MAVQLRLDLRWQLLGQQAGSGRLPEPVLVVGFHWPVLALLQAALCGLSLQRARWWWVQQHCVRHGISSGGRCSPASASVLDSDLMGALKMTG